MSSQAPHHALANQLRGAGFRVTAPRLAILELLSKDRRHPTAEMVYDALCESHPSISRSTVYSTLESFVHSGLIRKIATGGNKFRVDGTEQDHDHAVCRMCHSVFDVPKRGPRPGPPAELPSGSRVTNTYVEYEVVCAQCDTDTLGT